MPEKTKDDGALWRKESLKTGKTFWSGRIKGVPFVMFQNDIKDNPRRPEFVLLEAPEYQPDKKKEDKDDDIPF